MKIPVDGLREALNGDPEFALQARYWTTQFRLTTDSQSLLVTLRDGVVTSVDSLATPFDTWDFQLAGTDEQWANLLAATPPPFYQDYYAAMLYHGFRIEGDMRQIMAYYPAIRRTREVLSALVTKAVAA
ncbi:hypothetical protein ACWEOW_09750 [Monashia sp. NPDC004114]